MTTPLGPLLGVFCVAQQRPFCSEGKFLRARTLSPGGLRMGRWESLSPSLTGECAFQTSQQLTLWRAIRWVRKDTSRSQEASICQEEGWHNRTLLSGKQPNSSIQSGSRKSIQPLPVINSRFTHYFFSNPLLELVRFFWP